MSDMPANDTRSMIDVLRESLIGADRVVIETRNALGEMDAHYLHAPAVLADLPPTREQIMADPRVMALVEAARDALTWENHKHLWLDNLQDAYDALTDNEGETE